MITINLPAIQSNWLKLRSIANGAAIAGVIKANAYGLGAKDIGNALYGVGCREFFLASIDEALAARNYLPEDSIVYVLGGIGINNECLLIDSKITPVLCSIAAITAWANTNSRLGVAAPSAIKINTGMTRFGLNFNEFERLCESPELVRAANPLLVMSHLACADEPEHPLNYLQHDRFTACIILIKTLLPGLRFSLANSSGIFFGDDWHFDLCRPGAALYGINPTPNQPNPMSPVVCLSLLITQVRKLDAAATIGYGCAASLPDGARVAVVAGGYADGLHRTLGFQPEGYLNGHLIKAVGRISMDSTIFDISSINLPDEQLLGAKIEVINDLLSLDYLSQKNKSLGYEVLTSLGGRYSREYVKE